MPTLPNIRKLFVPDPGFVMIDADLAGADAQVVAWEADDADLKAAFRAGVKIHEKNARDIFGAAYDALPGDRGSRSSPKGHRYDQCKRAVHATNYGAVPRTLADNPSIGWPLRTCEDFQRTWFRLHPGIRENFQLGVERSIYAKRSVANRFGYRIVYFDRPDALYTQALAWIPQSTVAEVAFRGALRLESDCPWAEVLLNVHDSIVFQIPAFRFEPGTIDRIRRSLEIPVPYPDPLVIPWKLAASPVSWGDCKEISF